MNDYHSLIKAWRNCPFDTPPYILLEDEPEFSGKGTTKIFHSLQEYVNDPTFGRNDTTLRFDLMPIPYLGCLEKASIFILMLNPGLSPVDYFAEYENNGFRDILIRNLRQENCDTEFPFFSINPFMAWQPGFQYWEGKFRNLAQTLVNVKSILYWQALEYLSQRIACLELMPYRSKSFGESSLLNRLQSTKLMLDYVSEIVIPKTLNNEAIIIATRQTKNWKLPKHKNIILYEGAETRSAHLTLRTRGGKAIAEKLGL